MSGRFAAIVGASGGIGRETARLLARSGFALVLGGRRRAALDATADELVGEGADVSVVPLDACSPNGCERFVGACREKSAGSSVGLVIAAGSAKFGAFNQQGYEDLRTQIEANLLGPLFLLRAACGWLAEHAPSRVLLVGSIAAKHAFPGSQAYCASKAGLDMLGRSFAAEFRSLRILTTVLHPGATDTDIWSGQPTAPRRSDMLAPQVVAECIRDVLVAPPDRSFDEIVLMPPKGVL